MFFNSEGLQTTNTRSLIRPSFGRIIEPSCGWELRFRYRAQVIRSEVRAQVTRQWRFSGESFTQVWRNTGRIVGAASRTGLNPKSNLGVAQLCAGRIINLLSQANRLPESYNRLLIRAAAEYSLTVVRKISDVNPQHQPLLTEVRKFTSQLQDLISQYSRTEIGALALLDLQLFEDRFLSIQEDSERLGIFPRLNNIPVADLVSR
jgi:hypothetical protein